MTAGQIAPAAPAGRAEDYRARAQAALPAPLWDYLSGGAGEELTARANVDAFRRVRLVPRVLVDVAVRDTRTTLLGTEVAAPVAIAPMAYHRLAHHTAEAATVRAAGGHGVLTVVGVFSSLPLEEVARAAAGPLWFQTCLLRDRGLTRELADRAAAAGYRALVLTVDAPLLGHRDRDVRNAYRLPPDVVPANLFPAGGAAAPGGPALAELNSALVDPSATWDDVQWLRTVTRLPIVVKGVLHPDDAARAVECGAGAVVVSNHGGRQLDGAVATLDALPGVVRALDGRGEVYLDGGVRRGVDVVKALALGARAVLVGRPVLWGLAAGGEAGVADVLRLYRQELENAMAMCGCPRVADIGPGLVAPPVPGGPA